MNIQNIFSGGLYQNYLAVLFIVLISFSFSTFLVKASIYLINKVAIKINSKILTALTKINPKLLIIGLILIPVYFLTAYFEGNNEIVKILKDFGYIFIVLTVISFLSALISVGAKSYASKYRTKKIAFDTITITAKFLLWISGILIILKAFNININGILAGIGVVGIATALASQTVLIELFNYYTIAFDRPFDIGDEITVDGITGEVKSIGLVGTRLLSVSGEEIIVSNSDMTKNVIQNFGRLQKKRLEFSLSLKYGTPIDILKTIPEMMKNIIEKSVETEFGMSHLTKFDASGFTFETVFFLFNNDEKQFKDTIQYINYEIINKLAALKIELADPECTMLNKKNSK